MTSINVTVHTAGAMNGWTQADIDACDMLDTEATLKSLIERDIRAATEIQDVTVTVSSEDRGDFWRISNAADAMEERDLDEIVRDTLTDFPWYDAQRWAVFK